MRAGCFLSGSSPSGVVDACDRIGLVSSTGDNVQDRGGDDDVHDRGGEGRGASASSSFFVRLAKRKRLGLPDREGENVMPAAVVARPGFQLLSIILFRPHVQRSPTKEVRPLKFRGPETEIGAKLHNISSKMRNQMHTALFQGYPQQATFSFPLRIRFRSRSICVSSLANCARAVRRGLDARRLS